MADDTQPDEPPQQQQLFERKRILYCRCAYAQAVPPDVKDEVLRQLGATGAAFDAVADLCEMSAADDPRLKEIAAAGDVRICACFPRAVRWLFHSAGADLPSEGVEILNMRTTSADEIVQQLLAEQPAAAAESTSPEAAEDAG